MKVYISGKISGLPYEEAWINFQMAEEKLIEDGYDVVNPMKNGLDPDAPWEDHMKKDIELLMGCDAICLLGNWASSHGSRIERSLAASLRYRFIGVYGLGIKV